MNTSRVSAATDSLARAAGLAHRAMTAVDRRDHEAVSALLAAAEEALRQAKHMADTVVRAHAANDYV
jgi:cellobiose-specific phosphotransferase system component IIA